MITFVMGIYYDGLPRITFPFLEIVLRQLLETIPLSSWEISWLRSGQLEHFFAPMIHAGVGKETSQGLALLGN